MKMLSVRVPQMNTLRSRSRLRLSYEIDQLGQNIAHLEAQNLMLELLRCPRVEAVKSAMTRELQFSEAVA